MLKVLASGPFVPKEIIKFHRSQTYSKDKEQKKNIKNNKKMKNSSNKKKNKNKKINSYSARNLKYKNMKDNLILDDDYLNKIIKDIYMNNDVGNINLDLKKSSNKNKDNNKINKKYSNYLYNSNYKNNIFKNYNTNKDNTNLNLNKEIITNLQPIKIMKGNNKSTRNNKNYFLKYEVNKNNNIDFQNNYKNYFNNNNTDNKNNIKKKFLNYYPMYDDEDFYTNNNSNKKFTKNNKKKINYSMDNKQLNNDYNIKNNILKGKKRIRDLSMLLQNIKDFDDYDNLIYDRKIVKNNLERSVGELENIIKLLNKNTKENECECLKLSKNRQKLINYANKNKDKTNELNLLRDDDIFMKHKILYNSIKNQTREINEEILEEKDEIGQINICIKLLNKKISEENLNCDKIRQQINYYTKHCKNLKEKIKVFDQKTEIAEYIFKEINEEHLI